MYAKREFISCDSYLENFIPSCTQFQIDGDGNCLFSSVLHQLYPYIEEKYEKINKVNATENKKFKAVYAKGLSKKVVVFRHALRNALNPVITAITGWFAELLAGAFFVEYIFGWKGIGKITVDALEKLDFPVVMGSVLITATFFIIVNLLADVLYGAIDPRVRIK